MLYEAAIAAEIFGVDRSDLTADGSWYDLVVCTADGTPHPWLPHLPTASYAEIADDLDLPLSTVRGQLARARQTLVTEMEGWR